VRINGDRKDNAILKRGLPYIVRKALNEDLSEYMDTELLEFFNEHIVTKDDCPPYTLICSTIIGRDLHYIVNLCSMLRLKMNGEDDENEEY